MNGTRSKVYVMDFFKMLLEERNIVLGIYMLLNAFLAVYLGGMLMTMWFPPVAAYPLMVVIYLASLLAVFSPFGEWFLRWQVGAIDMVKKKKTAELARLEPIFMRVLERACRLNPEIEPSTKLFLNNDPSFNAFAVGRQTVVINTGMLMLGDDVIEAVLAHEVGHISQRDTDIRLAVQVGNVVLGAVFLLFNALVTFFAWVALLFGKSEGSSEGNLVGIIFFAIAQLLKLWVGVLHWIWGKIGMLVIAQCSRKQEFVADEFSVNCGCGIGLSRFFTQALQEDAPREKNGILANFTASHPQMKKRLIQLANLGVTVENAELLVES